MKQYNYGIYKFTFIFHSKLYNIIFYIELFFLEIPTYYHLSFVWLAALPCTSYHRTQISRILDQSFQSLFNVFRQETTYRCFYFRYSVACHWLSIVEFDTDVGIRVYVECLFCSIFSMLGLEYMNSFLLE